MGRLTLVNADQAGGSQALKHNISVCAKGCNQLSLEAAERSKTPPGISEWGDREIGQLTLEAGLWEVWLNCGFVASPFAPTKPDQVCLQVS